MKGFWMAVPLRHDFEYTQKENFTAGMQSAAGKHFAVCSERISKRKNYR